MTDPRELLAAGLSGRYLPERELGRGGMATVYLALPTGAAQRNGSYLAYAVLFRRPSRRHH